MNEAMERAYRPAVMRAFGHAAEALDMAGLPTLAAAMRGFDTTSPLAEMVAKAAESAEQAHAMAVRLARPGWWTRSETDASVAAETSFAAKWAANALATGDYPSVAFYASCAAEIAAAPYRKGLTQVAGAAMAKAAKEAERALCAEDVRVAAEAGAPDRAEVAPTVPPLPMGLRGLMEE